MNFKRLVSGVCAFAIAVTQTAIVPISVSATEYTYKPVPNFSSQFKVGSSIFSTSPKADNSEETNYHWNGPANDVETSAKQLVLDGSTIDKANTPDGATVVNFSFSTVIDDEYYKVGDEFDFTVSGFTATLTKNVEEAVEEKAKTISNGGALSTDSPITVDAYADAIDGSRITVTYTVDSADDAALDIVDADNASLSGGATFDASATTFEATLDENAAKTVAENGFRLSGNGIIVTGVSITVPAHKVSVPETETFVNNVERSWTQVCKGTWFDGSLTFTPETITINDFKDFVDNCSMTFEWSDITCTASRRISFSSVNDEIWSGDEDLNNWCNWISLPPFDYAEKFSRLIIEYATVEPENSSDEWSPAIKFVDMAGANGWENIPALHENGNEEGVITLDKDSTEITITLTKTAADALKNGALGFGGENVRITKVTSAAAVPVTTVKVDKTNFPNATFREFVSDVCDLDKDGELVPAELAMIKDINFNKPDPENPDEYQKYTDEKYQKIDDFTGIEYLTELTYIGIRENAAVRTLDVSACTKLDCIDAGNCENLETVTVPDSIKALYIYNSSVKSVDVSKCTSLEILFAFNAKLTSLDVSKNTSLKELNISDNNIAFIDLKGLNALDAFEADNNSYAISLTEDNKFDLSTLLDVSKFTLDDGQDVTLKDGVLTVDDGVSEITYTYDTGLDGKTFNGTFKVAAKTFDSVNATLWKGNKKFPYSWGVRIMLPAFSYAEKGTRLTVEYTVTPATEEEIKNDPENTDGEWWPIIGFKNDTDGAWTSLTGLHPDQDDTWGNITVDKASTSVTVTLTEEAAEALRNGMMGIEGANITVTAVKSLDVDPDAPKDVEINPANFPNDTFREIAKSYDTNNDDVLTYIERAKLRSLDLSEPDESKEEADKTYADDKYRQIDNFKGIEYFTNLQWFSISGNEAIESIDLSNNTQIGFAALDECVKLAEVKLPETLGGVNLCGTLVTEFDGSKYPDLTSLYMNSDVLTNVDVSTNTKLEALGIFGMANSTGTVSDITKNTELTDLTLGGCIIGKKLDLSKCPNITKLHLYNDDIVGIDYTGLSFDEDEDAYEVSNIYHNITVTDGKFDLDSLSDLGFDPAKATIADGQGVTRNKNILTVEEGVSEINYTYDTGLKGKSVDATFRVGGRTFGSVNATLWKGNKKFPHNWSENIHLPAFSFAEKGTRLTVEYTVTPPTDEELGNDEDWWAMIGFIDNAPDDENPDGKWANLKNLHPDQDDENGNIMLDKDSASITVTLTEEAAKALNDGVMVIQGANITVTAVKSLEADPDAPKDVEINPANFPNDTFREIVKTLDTNNDDVLTYIERSKLRYLNLSKPDENDTEADKTYADDKYRQIDNFKGIEYFTNLRGVSIDGNTAVTSIDLSSCTKLNDFVGANCPKLEKVVLPESVKEVYIYISGLKEFDAAKYPKLEVLKIFNTQVTSIDVSKNPNLRELDLGNDKLTSDVDISNCPELIELSVNSTGIKKLDVSKNKKLEILDIGGNKGIELIGIEDLTTLKELTAWTCGLTKLDVSKSKGLEKLHINDNSIVAIDLSGFESLTAFESDYQGRDIELINNTFNLADLSAYGLDPGKVTLEEPCGATRDGNVLTFPENVDSIQYTYDTGKDGMTLKVTLNVANRTESNFTVSYVENDKTVTVTADEWADVLKVMNNKNTDYVVYLNNDVTIKKLTFPTAAKAKSIAVYNPSGKTITTDASSVTLPIDTTLDNISIESTAKTFAITASKNLDISDFRSEKLKTLKGGAKSVLTFNKGAHNTVKADISGFGTIAFDKYTEAELLGTVKATTLKLNDSDTVIVKNNSVTFTNIEIAGEEAIMASICYGTDNFKPITVTGNITAENNASKIRIYKRVEKNIVSFSAEQTVLTAKTASFANVEVFENSMPEGEINYTLARVGSDIKLLAEKLKVVTLYEEGMNETVYAQWSDVLSTIAANAKAGQKDNEYHVTLLDDYNMNGAFKMPAAKTYSSLNLSSEQSVKTITFTGNITLTGFTIFNNIKLDAQKKSGKEFKPTDFTIAAGKNSLHLEYVKANIKSITSSGEVQLTGTTVGAVTANSVIVWANNENEMLGYAAMGAAWDGKTAPTTTVNITGNLTVKTLLELENNSSLSVGGILNAGELFALDDTVLVVKQQAKGKNALVIGKSGFDNNSGKINFVLVDPKTEKTAEITEDLILGTIAGPYADQLVPSNDNLTEEDSYYIIKSGKNLIAKPKATAGLVTVEVNGKKAYYKSLNEAIADINTSGSKTDDVVIYLTQDMFPKAVAKLPLPSAGKYGRLTLKADSDVTINITGDLALTGDLVLDKSIALNKIDKTGKVTALGVNVGKYTLTAKGTVSETTTDDSIISNFANISGAGKLCFSDTAVNVAGKVNGTTLIFDGSVVTLVGTKAGFTGSIEAGDDSELIYDKSIAKNVKFTNVTGQLELVVKDGEKTVEFEENAIVASITGDYTKDAVIVNGSDLKIVRSGNNLKAVKEENVLLVEASVSEGITTERTYDSLASAINDISRIKDKTASYNINISKDDTFALPKANTYKEVQYSANVIDPRNYITLTTTKDITLTGDLRIKGIILNKTDRNGKVLPMSVNLGNYTFNTSMSYISYNGNESQFANINGKGRAEIWGAMTVSGKINVGKFSINNTVKLGDRAAFTAVNTWGSIGGELCYPVSIAKNVVFTNIITNNETIKVKVDGVKAGDQIATLKGDYFTDTVVISNDSTLAAVRSGNKLVAVEKSSMNFVEVEDYSGTNTRAYDSIASAITDITRRNNAKVEYTIYLNSGDYVMPKLTLPAKGKCAAIRFSATTSSPVNITVSSDITLTCNLTLRGKIILKKAATKTNQTPKLKFTSPKNKDGTPTYKVYVDVDATIINGTLNGEPIKPTPTTP